MIIRKREYEKIKIGIAYLPTLCCRTLFYFLSRVEVARIYVGLEKVLILSSIGVLCAGYGK